MTAVRAFRCVARAAAALTIVMIVGGCVGQGDHYGIRLVPRGDSLERILTISRRALHEDSLRGELGPLLPQGDVEALFAAYRDRPDSASKLPFTARGRFVEIPDDVGNHGRYRHLVSLLGESWSYEERFRGLDDPESSIARNYAVADSLAAALVGWLGHELADVPEYPAASEDIARELHHVFRMPVAFGLIGNAGRDGGDLIAWAYALLGDHPLAILGLLPLPDERDTLTLAAMLSELHVVDAHIGRARTDLARRMGLASRADIERALPFLENAVRGRASVLGYAATPSGQLLRPAAWQGALERCEPLPYEPDPIDSIAVELELPCAPVWTNGRLDSASNRVRWRDRVAGRIEAVHSVPLVCVAHWAVPDHALQTRLFGSVLVGAPALRIYNEWWNALAPERQAEWDRMLRSLRPGRAEPLERFRFERSRGVALEPPGSDDSDLPRKLILDALSASTPR